MHDDSNFPSETIEGHGHFVGIAEHVGNAMTFKILTSDTNKIIHRSVVRSASKHAVNHRADMGRKYEESDDLPDKNITAPDSDYGETDNSDYGETIKPKTESVNKPYDETKHPPKVVTSRYDHVEDDVELPPMPIMNPEDLVGRTFLLDKQEYGQKFRARIVEAINAHEDKVQKNP